MFIVLIPLAYRMRTRKLRARTKKISSAQQLSVQEKKVFDLLKAGSSNKEISDALNIEVSTVKSHVHKIFSRLGVKSRKEIVNGDW